MEIKIQKYSLKWQCKEIMCNIILMDLQKFTSLTWSCVCVFKPKYFQVASKTFHLQLDLLFWVLLVLQIGQFWRGEDPISIFAQLRLQPQATDQITHSLHLLLHKSNLKIHANDDRGIFWRAEKYETLLWPKLLANWDERFKFEVFSRFVSFGFCCLTGAGKINKSYIDSTLEARVNGIKTSEMHVAPWITKTALNTSGLLVV